MSKTTVKASSDVALIKYWGKKDEILRLPENGSVSLILNGLDTITTVEFLPNLTRDDILIQGETDAGETQRVVKHLDRIRHIAQIAEFAKVVSQNSFPKGTGLSSSGSGFAALTLAGTLAAGLKLSTTKLSILARQGSGTACRCMSSGIVEWLDGETSDTSYSVSLYPPDYWQLCDVVAVVDEGKKQIASSEGHTLAHTSPFYQTRLAGISHKINALKKILKNKDFQKLGELIEAEALEFHSILLTSQPPLIAWYPGTIEVMLAVRALRQNGIPAYFTINTGFNVHVLTLPEHQSAVAQTLSKLPSVKKILQATIGSGPQVIDTHLF